MKDKKKTLKDKILMEPEKTVKQMNTDVMKARPLKKKITDAQEFDVEYSDGVGNSKQTTIKKVQANNPEEALRKAKQNDPKANKAKDLKVKVDETAKSVQYPYSIMLPLTFKDVLTKSVKGTDIKIMENNPNIYVKILSEKHMDIFLTNLKNTKDNRSMIIIEGIKKSV